MPYKNWKFQYKKILAAILDFILPRTKTAKEIAEMNVSAIFDRANPANPLPITASKALFSYKDPLVKNAIWLLKYRQNKDAARLFGEALGNIAGEWLEDLRTFENFSSPIVIPVPMTNTRKSERGGNHTEKLCEFLIKSLPNDSAEYKNNALFKIRETESQAKTKNRQERLKNLSDSFSANQKIIRGRNILLIDDVITTGATVEEIRKTLLRAGAKKVVALSIAH